MSNYNQISFFFKYQMMLDNKSLVCDFYLNSKASLFECLQFLQNKCMSY